MSFNLESNFEYKGYRCVTVIQDTGFRCGYVGIPKGHILYGKKYHDKLNVKFEDVQGEPLGRRNVITLFTNAYVHTEGKVSLELFFDVHGSLTYADGGGNSTYPICSDLWWLGFDCAHYGDKPDLKTLKKLYHNNERMMRRIAFNEGIEKEVWFVGEIRTVEYVQNECKNLVDQIIDYCKTYEKGK